MFHHQNNKCALRVINGDISKRKNVKKTLLFGETLCFVYKQIAVGIKGIKSIIWKEIVLLLVIIFMRNCII